MTQKARQKTDRFTKKSPVHSMTRAERVRAAYGKFAHVPFGSDDHAREKLKDIEREG